MGEISLLIEFVANSQAELWAKFRLLNIGLSKKFVFVINKFRNFDINEPSIHVIHEIWVLVIKQILVSLINKTLGFVNNIILVYVTN